MRVQGVRLMWLDQLRGLAIALMVVDHACELAGGPWWVRHTVTRLSLPLFMACAGWLVASRGPPRPRRVLEVFGLGLVIGVGSALFATWRSPVDVLLLLAPALALSGYVRRFPWWCAALGLCQALYLPIPIPNYQPGLVVCWLALGVLVAQSRSVELEVAGACLPRWLGALGRRPLAWYAAHLVVLATIGSMLS